MYQLTENSVLTTTITDVYIHDLQTGNDYPDDIAQSMSVSNYSYLLGVFLGALKDYPGAAVTSLLIGAYTQMDANARYALSSKIKSTIKASSINAIRIRYTRYYTSYGGYTYSAVTVSYWDGHAIPNPYTASGKYMPLISYSHSAS